MKNLITLLFLTLSASIFGQFTDDFSDGDLTENPEWKGDIDKFVVSEDILKLNDNDAGYSYIYTSVIFPQDSAIWHINVVLDFSPSANNGLDIYFALDGNNPASSAGYSLHIGENGSNDALILNKIVDGELYYIGSGSLGAVGEDPVEVSIKVEYFDSTLSIYADYGSTGFFGTEPEIIAVDQEIPTQGVFGLACTYSSSRSKSFYFDNISLNKYAPDTTAPSILDYEIINDRKIQLKFDEAVDEGTITSTDNYELNNNNVANVVYNNDQPNQVIIEFQNTFSAKQVNLLTIRSIIDLYGNEVSDVSISFNYARLAYVGDLKINEILTDPIGEGSDFVELYNSSDDNITLQGCKISNTQNGKIESLSDEIISPKGYIAITENPQNIIETYSPIESARIVENELPSFNNDSANITLLNADDDILDALDYSDDFHLDLLSDTEGISLERISTVNNTQLPSNWQSSASIYNYGTPGFQNSNALAKSDGMDNFSLTSESFSPNQDGIDDVIGIAYKLPKPGYISNVRIYDAEGYEIKRLQNNETLGTSGVITWKGFDDNNILSSIGMYIAVGELYHPDGDKRRFKLAFALLDYIK